MRNSKKIAAAAGVLWSFALIGAGAAQAFGHDGSGGSGCVDDGKGNVRCVQERVYRDAHGTIHIFSDQTQTCGTVGCTSNVFVGGKKS